MHIKIHAIAALTFAAALGGCSQEAMGPQQQPPQQDGGYGGYGAAPQAPMTPTSQSPMQPGGEAVLSGAGGNVPQQFQTLVTDYLDRYAQQMAPNWPRVDGVPDVVAGLNANTEHRWQVRLRGGRSYAFIGACDNECSNLDLILEDSASAPVDSDVLDDDYPLVEVTPPADGVYTLRIQLKTCTIAPCYVAARLVARS